MSLAELLRFIWNIAFGIAFAIAVGILIQPQLSDIFNQDFALGVWSFAMVVTTAMWMLSYLCSTFWEVQILDSVFEQKHNPRFQMSYMVLPILIGLGFAVLVAHAWKLYIVLPSALLIGFIELIGMSLIIKGICEMLVKAAKDESGVSEEGVILRAYFLERPHLVRIVAYMIVLCAGVGFAILSLGGGLFSGGDMTGVAEAVERNRTLFDRMARVCFLAAVWGNEICIWSWRISRSRALKAAGKPWWF